MDGDNNVPEDMEPEQLLFGLVRGEIIYVPRKTQTTLRWALFLSTPHRGIQTR